MSEAAPTGEKEPWTFLHECHERINALRNKLLDRCKDFQARLDEVGGEVPPEPIPGGEQDAVSAAACLIDQIRSTLAALEKAADGLCQQTYRCTNIL